MWGTGTVARWQIVGACVHVTRTLHAAGTFKGNCRMFSKPETHSPATAHGAGHLGGHKPRCSALTTAVSWRGCSSRTQPCYPARDVGRGPGCHNPAPDATHKFVPFCSSVFFVEACRSHEGHRGTWLRQETNTKALVSVVPTGLGSFLPR